jgi:hypothetical protein
MPVFIFTTAIEAVLEWLRSMAIYVFNPLIDQ